jgi:hypothetical protein
MRRSEHAAACYLCLLICFACFTQGQHADTAAAEAAGVWLSAPRNGALFRPGEPVQLTFERSRHVAYAPWQRLAVAVAFDREELGEFAFAAGNSSMQLMLGAVPAGHH